MTKFFVLVVTFLCIVHIPIRALIFNVVSESWLRTGSIVRIFWCPVTLVELCSLPKDHKRIAQHVHVGRCKRRQLSRNALKLLLFERCQMDLDWKIEFNRWRRSCLGHAILKGYKPTAFRYQQICATKT